MYAIWNGVVQWFHLYMCVHPIMWCNGGWGGGGGGGHATQWRLRAVFEMAPYQSAMAWLRGSYLNGVQHLYS